MNGKTNLKTALIMAICLLGILGTASGEIIYVDASASPGGTGQTAWTDATARGSRGFGAIVGADSCLIALTNDSELIVFKSDGKAYSEIQRYKVTETVTNAHPVIAGNRVFIKDQETLTMWTI